MKSRKYPSVEEAYEHLKTLGEFTMHGRAGTDYEFMVCSLVLSSGIRHILYVYRDGNVILRE